MKYNYKWLRDIRGSIQFEEKGSTLAGYQQFGFFSSTSMCY